MKEFFELINEYPITSFLVGFLLAWCCTMSIKFNITNTMETTEKTNSKVKISDYMQGRSYNKTLYGRLIEKINSNCGDLFKENPDVNISITLSAKYQTPRAIIMKGDYDGVPESVGKFERGIMEALAEVGFEYSESVGRDSYYIIEFTD